MQEAIDRDGYCVLPLRLPPAMIERAMAYIDGYCADPARYGPEAKTEYCAESPVDGGNGHQETNIVELDAIWRDFLSYKPAMQLCYDCFGPLFRLGQDKWTRKYRPGDPDAPEGADELPHNSIGWHSCVCHPLRGVWLLSPRHGCWCLAVTARLASRRCGSTCRSTRFASGVHRPCPSPSSSWRLIAACVQVLPLGRDA